MNAVPERKACRNCAAVCAYVFAVIGSFLIIGGLVWVMWQFTRPAPLGEDRAEMRRKTLAEVRGSDAETLYNSAYVWEDQTKGIVRMPIKDAMAMALRLWQDPVAARTNMFARAEKKYFVPPPVPSKFD